MSDDKQTQTPVCNWCKLPSSKCGPLLATKDKDTLICEHCSVHAVKTFQAAHYDADKGHVPQLAAADNIKKPSEIVRHLNEYVIGQHHSKKVLAVASYNHYKRVFKGSGLPVELKKANVLLVGPTGSGKTLLAQTLAKCIGVPFAIGDATTLTEAGYVGEDVENLIVKLLQAADYSVPATQLGMIYIDEIDKIRRSSGNVSITRDVSGEGVQRGLLKLVEGTVANVPPAGGRKHPEQKYIPVDTSNILFIVGGAFVGLEEVVAKRLNKRAIGFTSEQEILDDDQKTELLKEVVPDDLIQFGMIPELVGRFPVVSGLSALSNEEMLRILTEPKNALLRQYDAMLGLDGCTFQYTPGAVQAIVDEAKKLKTGARGLQSVCESIMLDVMYHAPDNPGHTYVLTEDVVKGKKSFFE